MNNCTHFLTCLKILVHYLASVHQLGPTLVSLQISDLCGLLRMLPIQMVRGVIIQVSFFFYIFNFFVSCQSALVVAFSVLYQSFYFIPCFQLLLESHKYLPYVSKHAGCSPNSFFNFLSSLLSARLLGFCSLYIIFLFHQRWL